MEPISFFLFFLVVIPFLLDHFDKQRKTCREMLEQSKETSRL